MAYFSTAASMNIVGRVIWTARKLQCADHTSPPLRSATKWIVTAAGIAGAMLIALNIGAVSSGFVLFLISSVLWTVAAIAQREPSLVALQAAFTIINVLGTLRWMAT